MRVTVVFVEQAEGERLPREPHRPAAGTAPVSSRSPAGFSPLARLSALMFGRRKNQLRVCAGSEVMAVGSSAASGPADGAAKPLLGLRRRPGRLALAVFRLPLPLYRRGWGGLLGHTFLLLVHAGRKTGKPQRQSSARPGARTPTGSATSGPARRCRSRSGGSRSRRSSVSCPRRRAWPWWHDFAATRGGCASSHRFWAGGDLRSDTAAQEFVSARPFLSLRPADPART
jgi:hypothetical protein